MKILKTVLTVLVSLSSLPSANAQTKPFKLSCGEARFVRLLNRYRESNGLNTLYVSRAGTRAARWHAQDMIDKGYFDHTEPGGRDPFDRMEAFGYDGVAENILYGAKSAEQAFCMWRNSPGHNSNMLSRRPQSIGVGRRGTFMSNAFGAPMPDREREPLTDNYNCKMPTQIPRC